MKRKRSNQTSSKMLSFYCSNCTLVFHSVGTLHAHIKVHVPDGSYTFDFTSQTGYPNTKPFPAITIDRNLGRCSPIIKEVQTKQTCVTSDKKSDKKKTSKSANKKMKAVLFPSLKVKEVKVESQTDTAAAAQVENEVTNITENDPVDACGESSTVDNTGFSEDYIPDDDENDDFDDNNGENDNEENTEIVDSEKAEEKDESEVLDGVDNEKAKEINKPEDVDLETDNESNENQRPIRNCTRRTLLQDTNKYKYKMLGFKTKYTGKKKYLTCEVCGVKKEQYVLIEHIESMHSDETLSQSFLQKLHQLRAITQRRKKPVKPKTKQNDSDEDFKLSEEEEEEKEDKEDETFTIGKEKRRKVFHFKSHSSKKKSYSQCKICCMFISTQRIAKHEKFHKTRVGKKMFHPDNLAKCEKCTRVVLKANIEKHKCFLIKPAVKDEEPSQDDQIQVTKQERKKISKNHPMPCHICGILVNRYKMKNHVRAHSDNRPFGCDICKKRYFTAAHLKKHKSESHGERIHQCDKCPKAFISKYILQGHMMMHSNERPHVCPVCGVTFRRRGSLNSHLNGHAGLEPRFMCNHCGKKFTRKTNVTTHVKAVHQRVKDWICSWPACAKQFDSGTVLRRHMLIHTGDKPNECNICSTGFSQRTELKLHLEKKHNIDVLPPPSNSNPFSGLPVHIVQNPNSKEEDKTKKLKTVMFPKAANAFENHVVTVMYYSASFTQEYKPSPQLVKPSSKPEEEEEEAKDKPIQSEPMELTVNQDNKTSLPLSETQSQEPVKPHVQQREVTPELLLEPQQQQQSSPIVSTAVKTSYSTPAATFSPTSSPSSSDDGSAMNSHIQPSLMPYSQSQSSFHNEFLSSLVSNALESTALESSALEPTHLESTHLEPQPMGSSHMMNPATTEYQQLSNAGLGTSVMKVEPMLDTNTEHIWSPF